MMTLLMTSSLQYPSNCHFLSFAWYIFLFFLFVFFSTKNAKNAVCKSTPRVDFGKVRPKSRSCDLVFEIDKEKRRPFIWFIIKADRIQMLCLDYSGKGHPLMRLRLQRKLWKSQIYIVKSL